MPTETKLKTVTFAKNKKRKTQSEYLEYSTTPQYRRPQWSHSELQNITTIAKDYAQAFNSDPFAFKRIRHYMIEGMEAPSDIASIADGILKARAEKKLTASV
jgi:hypothetical protein